MLKRKTQTVFEYEPDRHDGWCLLVGAIGLASTLAAVCPGGVARVAEFFQLVAWGIF